MDFFASISLIHKPSLPRPPPQEQEDSTIYKVDDAASFTKDQNLRISTDATSAAIESLPRDSNMTAATETVNTNRNEEREQDENEQDNEETRTRSGHYDQEDFDEPSNQTHENMKLDLQNKSNIDQDENLRAIGFNQIRSLWERRKSIILAPIGPIMHVH